MPKTLEFYGHFGSYSVRPQLSLENDTLSSIGLGYDVSSNLEIGGFLGYSRNSTKQADTEAVSSSVAVGPRAYYYTEIAGFPVEAEAAFLLGFGTAETTTKGTTTKTKDESSIAFEVKAKIVKELSSGLEYVGGVGYGYESLTKKKNDTDQKEESTISGMSLNITPAGLRYSF
jgi:hypothetical protein